MRSPEILLGCCQAGTSRIMHTQGDLLGPKRAHLALNRREASAPNATRAGCFLGLFGPNRHRRGAGFLAFGVERTFCQTGLSAGGPAACPNFPLGLTPENRRITPTQTKDRRATMMGQQRSKIAPNGSKKGERGVGSARVRPQGRLCLKPKWLRWEHMPIGEDWVAQLNFGA